MQETIYLFRVIRISIRLNMLNMSHTVKQDSNYKYSQRRGLAAATFIHCVTRFFYLRCFPLSSLHQSPISAPTLEKNASSLSADFSIASPERVSLSVSHAMPVSLSLVRSHPAGVIVTGESRLA